MRPKQITQSITHLIDKKIPTFLWGSPGIGKSSIVKQIAQKKQIKFIDLRLALLDPTDLKGIPFLDSTNHQAIWAPPVFLPKDGEGVLFLDELNSAPPAVQASAYQLVLDRKVGEYVLPDGWSIIAAGNLESDKAIVYKMASPLANRFVHLNMEVDTQDWIEWAYSQKIDESIIAYINYKPNNLFNFDAKSYKKSFATPRSWSYVDQIIKTNIDKTILNEVIAGAIGEALAIDYLSFSKVFKKLPNIDDIFDGNSQEYSDEVDVLYALCSVLTTQLIASPTPKRVENLLKYSLKLQPEFSVMLIQDLQRQNVPLDYSDIFEQWVERFAYLL